MRTRSMAAIGTALCAVSGRAAAQTCAPQAMPYFEFQVETPAAFAGDTTRVPRPASDRFVRLREQPDPGAMLVQFVVDTLGVPDPRSFRVLRAQTPASVDSVRDALPRWRFTPARVRGCRVSQLVQTAVTH